MFTSSTLTAAVHIFDITTSHLRSATTVIPIAVTGNMLSHRLLRAQRIPLLRPLRPPNGRLSATQSRLFARTALYMISSRPATRPQLPYLSQPTIFRQQPLINYQISRLLSTETRERVIAQAWLTAKWFVIVYTFIFLGWVAWMGILIQQAELRNPTPHEWRFWTQQYMRGAREEMDAVKEKKKVVIDWVKAGLRFKEVLRRLEDPAYDGGGLLPAGAEGAGLQEENTLIPGIGKAGYDISAKSYEWRTCYFEVLMGCAIAAEQLDDMLLDTTRKAVFPKDMVVGPSNPDPRPTPTSYISGGPPLEENCEPAYEKPEVFYMRILTGKGFSTRQRLDAAEAYANWLNSQGLPGSAEEMHRWALDIAKAALPLPVGVVVDEKTDILKEDAGKEATSNLLRATTGLAVHHARTGNVPAALPILLSVLRARSNAPLSTDPFSLQDESTDSKRGGSGLDQALSTLAAFFRASKFPPPPPTGDEPFTRRSETPSCVESELMLYIGEILFASTSGEHRQEGINWTRQAVQIAEANLTPTSGAKSERESDQCKQCLLTGVQNWEVMLQQFAAAQRATASREGGRNAGWLEWRGWFGRDGGVKGRMLDEAAAGVVEEELKAVEKLKQRLAREAIEAEEEEEASRNSFVWIR